MTLAHDILPHGHEILTHGNNILSRGHELPNLKGMLNSKGTIQIYNNNCTSIKIKQKHDEKNIHYRMPLPCFSKLNSESIIYTSTGVLANFYRIYVNKPNIKYTWLYRFVDDITNIPVHGITMSIDERYLTVASL
jgi:hypothetical protein